MNTDENNPNVTWLIRQKHVTNIIFYLIKQQIETVTESTSPRVFINNILILIYIVLMNSADFPAWLEEFDYHT